MTATVVLTPPLDHAWIAAHIPHAGTMCVLDSVDAWDTERIRCTATSHRDPDNPLRAHGRLASVCGIEYARMRPYSMPQTTKSPLRNVPC